VQVIGAKRSDTMLSAAPSDNLSVVMVGPHTLVWVLPSNFRRRDHPRRARNLAGPTTRRAVQGRRSSPGLVLSLPHLDLIFSRLLRARRWWRCKAFFNGLR
jgi:hypothetical protein